MASDWCERLDVCATRREARRRALGLTQGLIKTLSSQIWGWSEEDLDTKQVEGQKLGPKDCRLRLTLDLARELIGAPRHLSQHPGGFVLTHDRLDELVPLSPPPWPGAR